MLKRRNYSIMMVTGLGSLVLVAIVGTFSYIFGYVFGEKALQGVTPLLETGNPEGSPRNPNSRRSIPLVLEVDVVSETAPELTPPDRFLVAKNPRIRSAPVPTPTPTSTPTVSSSSEPTPAPISTPTPIQASTPAAQAPEAVAPAGSVVMNVLSAQRQGGAIVLNVTMQNNSNQTVRFLYSFMDVRDNNGRVLSASTSGLPGELPPNSTVYSGTVRIPEIFVQGSSSVSLSLPDYPSQRMWLRVGGVPLP